MSVADNSGRAVALRAQARMAYSGYLIEQQALLQGKTNRINSSGAAGSAINNYAIGPVSFTPTELASVLQANSAIPAIPPKPPGPTVPDPATNVTGVSGNTDIALSWNAPGSDGGAAITLYTVTTTDGSGGTWTTPDGVTTTLTATGLINGIAYRFTVVATNANGDSVPSAPSSPITPFTIPGQPNNLTGIAENTAVALSWNAPVSNGGSAITSYTATTTDGVGGTWRTPDGVPSTTLTAFGLVNGTAYTFTVFATNARGDSVSSAPSSSITPATVPNQPTFYIEIPGDSSVYLQWLPPSDNGGSAITTYLIKTFIAGTQQGLTFDTHSTNTSYIMSNLINGTEYTFTLIAVNIMGNGAESEQSPPFTPFTVPNGPTDVAAIPGDSSAQVTWKAPLFNGGSAITLYTVTTTDGAGGTWTTADGATITILASGLQNGTAYSFIVTATNQAGISSASVASAPVTPATFPGQAFAINGIPGNTQVSLTWAAPLSDGGSAITSYIILAYTGGVNISKTTISPAALAGIVTNLLNGTLYAFTIIAKNAVGEGVESSPSDLYTPVAQTTVPDPPTGLTASPFDSSAIVGWIPPINTGGTAITGYLITASPGFFQTPAGPTDTNISVSNLANGTQYTFTAIAINSVGSSIESQPSAPIIPATFPNPPFNVAASIISGPNIRVEWDTPFDGGSAILSYTVISFPPGVNKALAFSPLLEDGISIGMQYGIGYVFYVIATNAFGDSSSSANSPNQIAIIIPPSPPQNFAVIPRNLAFIASWNPPANDGGSLIISYTVQYGTGQFVTVDSTVFSTEIVVGQNDIIYSVTVFAKSQSFDGTPTAPIDVTPTLTVPDPPSILFVSAGPGSITVNIAPPSYTGGGNYQYYRVIDSNNSVNMIGDSPLVINGLDSAITYTFVAYMATTVGTSGASDPSSSINPQP